MKKIKIMYSGGGTLGPVTPLLAIHEALATEFGEIYEPIWLGTRNGIEQDLVKSYGIPYHAMMAGKLRRYISFWNITDLIKIFIGVFQAIWFLSTKNPTLCISAGGFVSVPVHFAAWLLGIPTWIHQQDVQVSLANRLMKPFARKITTVLEVQTKLFSPKKTSWLGNPIRTEIFTGSKKVATKLFSITKNLPILLVTGGGTGSQKINQLLVESLPHLRGVCEVIHLTGRDRPQELVIRAAEIFKDYYHTTQFLTTEMKDVYAAADLIISRGGFGTITEIAAIKKPVIVIPKPGHQLENVQYFEKLGGLYSLDEREIDANYLGQMIKRLLSEPRTLTERANKLHSLLPPAKTEQIVGIVKELLK